MHKSYIAILKLSKCDITIPITTEELDIARLYWVKSIQHSSFQQELRILAQGNPLPRSNRLLRLTSFLDSENLLCIGGRLQFSLLPENVKHPLILPRDSPLTSLIIADAHKRTIHRGTQITVIYSKQLLDH